MKDQQQILFSCSALHTLSFVKFNYCGESLWPFLRCHNARCYNYAGPPQARPPVMLHSFKYEGRHDSLGKHFWPTIQ